MTKVDYPALAVKIVELIGGNDNIKSVTHCITRVRFFLKDQEIAHNNTEAISEVPGVIQVVEAGGQYQVCIGTTVEKMYDEMVSSLAGDSAPLTQAMTRLRQRSSAPWTRPSSSCPAS